MRNSSELRWSFGGLAPALALAVAIILAAASGPLLAQETPVEAPASAPVEAPPGAGSPLVEEVLSTYRVLPVEGGIALDRRKPQDGIERIEIRGDRVYVNGAFVPESVLETWLGDDAGPILELLAAPAAERRSLFGLPAEPRPETSAAEEPAESEGRPVEAEGVTPSPRAEVEESPGSSDHREAVEETPAPSPPASLRQSEARVSVGRRVTIERDEVAEDVVVIGNDLEVDGEILGDALAVGGDVEVDGRVSGDVASVGGTVRLEDEAQVHGNVVSVGGGIERHPDARVYGEYTEVALGRNWLDLGDRFKVDWGDFDWDGFGWDPPFRGAAPQFAFWETSGHLAKIVFLTFFAALIFLIFRPQVQRAESIARVEPWKSGLVGLAAILLFWLVALPVLAIVSLILTITIIGIPFVVVLIFAVAVVAIALPLVGYSTSALWIGSYVSRRFPGRVQQGLVTVLVGVAAIELWSFLAQILGQGGWVLFIPFALFAFFGWLVRFTAWTVGLGAVLLAFGRGRGWTTAPGSNAPLPPLPQLPERELEELDREVDELGRELEDVLRETDPEKPSIEEDAPEAPDPAADSGAAEGDPEDPAEEPKKGS